jgi:hypothetical protein
MALRRKGNPVSTPLHSIPVLVQVPRTWAEGEAYVEDDRVQVREFTEDDADEAQQVGQENKKQLSGNTGAEILGVVSVLRAWESDDQIAAKNALLEFRKLRSGEGLAYQVAKRLVQDPDYVPDTLVYDVSRQLDGVRLVLWKKMPNRKLGLGLFCPNLGVAFWIHSLLSALGTAKGFRICPKCGNVFLQARPDQDYCSIRCRESHRLERWRAKKKLKGHSKKTVGSKSQRRGPK